MTERPPHSPCRRNDRHDAHEFEVYGRPFWCPGHTPAPKLPAATTPQLFHLQRDRDISGVSGTGRVANGVLWPDGTVTLRWIGDRPSTVNWERLADAIAIHGHGGATRLVWATPQPPAIDQTAAPSTAVRQTLRRWAYAAGHIEAELDGVVDRMYELIARDVRRMAGETATTETQAGAPGRRQTVEYFVQSQQPDGTWESASSFSTDLGFAAARLAARREKMPDLTLRLAERTTTVAVRALPDCLSCRHWSCDGTGECGALLDAWQRCDCTGPAAGARQDGAQSS